MSGRETTLVQLMLIVLMANSSLAPFAYALPQSARPQEIHFADPTPTAIPAVTPPSPSPTVESLGICTITTFDEAEGKRFLDAVYNFNGKALSDRSDAKIKESKPANATTVINNNIYNFPSEESTQLMPLADAAKILGKDPKAIADDLGIQTNETVTAAQVRAIAESDPANGKSILDKLRGYMASKNSKPKDQVQVPGFEQLKVKLPNGKEMPLSDIYRYQALRQADGTAGSCLLDNADIRGKVSYIGLLDKNLLIGADRADNTLDQKIPGETVAQHLNTESIRAAVTNSEGNIVVPSFYEKAIGIVGAWNKLDLFITSWSAAFSVKSVGRLEKEQTRVLEQQQSLQQLTPLTATSMKDLLQAGTDVDKIAGTAIGTRVQGAYKDAWVASRYGKPVKMVIPDELSEYVVSKAGDPGLRALLESQGGLPAGSSSPDAIKAALTKIMGDQTTPEAQLRKIRELLPTEFGGASVDSIEKAGQLVGSQDKIYAIDADIATSKELQDLTTSRAYTSFALGLLWLGPARFALEMSEPLVFSSDIKPEAKRGDFLLIYANDNSFANSFKKGSDFFFIGTFVSMASDFLQKGVPSKIFHVSNLILLQEPGESGQERDSITSLAKSPAGGWLIQTNWQGKSDATAFEDIHDGRKMTSLAVKSNYLRIGGQLNRREELQQLYSALLVAAPLLAWKLSAFGTLDATIITLIRVQTLQYYVDNLVDPNSFDPNEECSDSKMAWFKAGYIAATSLSVAEQLLLYNRVYKTAVDGTKTVLQKVANNPLANRYFGSKVVSYADPVGFFKYYWANLLLKYTSTCKDPSYKLMAYQSIQKSTTVGAIKDAKTAVTQKVNDPLGINKILGSLNIGSALAGQGSQDKIAKLDEVLNIRSTLTNQNGQVKPQELYYLHLDADSSNLEWFNVFDQNACFRQCLESDDAFICADKGGVKKVDKKTGETVYLAPDEYGLMTEFLPGLGMVVPNKIITTTLSCGDAPAIRFNGDGTASVDGNCEAMQCTMNALGRISGLNTGTDLRPLGKFRGIHTSQATGNPSGGEVRMFRTIGTQTTYGQTAITSGGLKTTVRPDQVASDKNVPVGSDIKAVAGAVASAVSNTENLAGREKRYGAVELLGNGLTRGAGSAQDIDQYGTFQTASFDNGVIHYDASNGKLYIALRVLAMAPGRDVAAISATPAVTNAPKADLEDQSRRMVDLLDKLSTNQKLTQAELEALRQALNRPSLTGAGLSESEKPIFQSALAKQSSGTPLSEVERKVLEKAAAAERYPGVIVLPPEKINTIERSLTETKVLPQAQADKVVTDLRQGQPITPTERAAITQALDKAVADQVVSRTDAEAVKSSLNQAVSSTDRAAEVVKAAESGTALTDVQRETAMAAVRQEQQRVESGLATATNTPVPGIKLGNVVAKPGAEDSARSLNTALDKVGALTHLSTDTKTVAFGTDDKGNAVVNIGDKKTGTFDQFKITGAPTQQGSAVVYPTDKGPVKVDVTVNPETGAPILNLNAPNNINEKAPLVLAQGPGGLLYYDPATGTWQVRNGLAVPADAEFRKGASFIGGQDGTQVVPDSNRLSNQQSLTNSGQPSSPLLALPGWSDNPLIAMLMVLLVLAGALYVRRRE